LRYPLLGDASRAASWGRKLRSTALLESRSTHVDGKQYVATISGVVSTFVGDLGTSAIIVFALH